MGDSNLALALGLFLLDAPTPTPRVKPRRLVICNPHHYPRGGLASPQVSPCSCPLTLSQREYPIPSEREQETGRLRLNLLSFNPGISWSLQRTLACTIPRPPPCPLLGSLSFYLLKAQRSRSLRFLSQSSPPVTPPFYSLSPGKGRLCGFSLD